MKITRTSHRPTQPTSPKKSTKHLNLPPDNRSHWSDRTAGFIRGVKKVAVPLMVRREYSGLENVPKDEAYIIGPSHQHYLDAVIASDLVGDKPLGSMGAIDQFKGPVGTVMSNFGVFPVDRYDEYEGDFPDPIDHAVEILDTGKPFMMYPEGKIYSDDQVYPLKSGLGRIAMKTKAKYALPVAQGFTKDTESHPVETGIGALLTAAAAAGTYFALGSGSGIAGVAAGIVGAAGLGATYHWTHRKVAHLKVGKPINLEPYRDRAAKSDDPKAAWKEGAKLTADHHTSLAKLKHEITGTPQKFKMDQSGNEWGLQPDGTWVRVERNSEREWVPI